MNESEFPAAVQTILSWYQTCNAPMKISQSNINKTTVINTGLFFIGAVDCMCLKLEFDNKTFMLIAGAFFEAIGLDIELNKQLILSFNSLANEEPAKSIITQGGQTFERWVNKDKSVENVYSTLKSQWDNQ